MSDAPSSPPAGRSRYAELANGPAFAIAQKVLVAALALGSQLAVTLVELTRGGFRVALAEARAFLRFDVPLLILVALFLIAFVPIIPRATENSQLLQCCINDEPYLTMALDGMRFWPFGDPHNFLMAPSNGIQVPDYW